MLKLIDFYAEWCGPCKMMKPIIEELEKEYEGTVEFAKMDVEEAGPEAQKYSVMSIPTFVLEKDGEEIDRKMGAMPKDVLKGWIEANK
jgi:thioredoxin 1